MFQPVRTAYQLTSKRSARLNVVQLEERATPATGVEFLLYVDPPEMVHVVVTPPPPVPTQQALACNASVRADLFGVGDAGEEHVDALEEMLSADQAARKDNALTSAAEQQTTDDANSEAETDGAVIIEDMVYVPFVE